MRASSTLSALITAEALLTALKEMDQSGTVVMRRFESLGSFSLLFIFSSPTQTPHSSYTAPRSLSLRVHFHIRNMAGDMTRVEMSTAAAGG
ncbi:uncharacterized [Tachysurus ichikawai]